MVHHSTMPWEPIILMIKRHANWQKYFPEFSNEAIDQFAAELTLAGGFEKLMIQKKAIKKRRNAFVLLHYQHPYHYSHRFLTGPYADYRSVFEEIKLPYDFWLQLHLAFQYRQLKRGMDQTDDTL